MLVRILETRSVPQSRAERLIATGRLVLAVAALTAIYLDPLEPARYVAFAYSLLVAYALYALIVAIWSAAATLHSTRWQIISHAADLAFFGVINYTTAGTSSPFFVFFIFSLVCAILRFGRRGMLLTAAVATLVFLASGMYPPNVPGFELNRFVIRSTYLLVIASLLFYVSDYQQRMHSDLSRIAAWPRSSWRDRDELVKQLLHEASSIFNARRALLAYDYLGERVAYFLEETGEDFRCSVEPREVADLLLDAGDATFVTAKTATGKASLVRRGREFRRARLPRDLIERYNPESVLATSFEGDFVRGRILLLDGRPALLEDVNLAKITAGVIAGRLDHYYAAEQLQRGAVAEERVRLARDLHDSVLQSLTGVALQLRTLPRVMARDPDDAQQRLQEIGEVIAADQKGLRKFIEELRPKVDVDKDKRTRLSERLQVVSDRFSQERNLEIDCRVEPVVHMLSSAMQQEIFALVSEAIANAAKHAEAEQVGVAVRIEGKDVVIDVADDGKGFPFRGRFDLDELIATRRGPVTLKERVLSLDGKMMIQSSAMGTLLEMRIPMRGAEP